MYLHNNNDTALILAYNTMRNFKERRSNEVTHTYIKFLVACISFDLGSIGNCFKGNFYVIKTYKYLVLGVWVAIRTL
jgi:hypothetical protein